MEDDIMIKKCFAIFILLLLLTGQVVLAGENKIIKAVEITGNSYTNTKKIKKVLETKTGQEYSENELNKDIENIFDMNSFKDVMVDVSDFEDGVKVTFIVVEKYLIKRLDFKGNREFSNKAIEDKIGSAENNSFDRKQMIDDVDIITDIYKKKGYSDVLVEPFTDFDDEGKSVTLTFFITEGNKIKVGKINLIGVRSFKTDIILGQLEIEKGRLFKPEEMEEEIKKIEIFYKNGGFVNFRLGETLVTYNKEKTKVFITIFLYEGISYKIGKTEFKGNSKFSTEELKKCLRFNTGDVFSELDLTMSLALMQEKYAGEGYIKASIVPEYGLDDEKGIADIKFKLVEGGVVYVNHIYIEGNTNTKDYVIRRELLIKSGDVFDVKKIRRSQEKIYNLGYFQDIRLDLNETEYPDRVDLILSVEEQMSGMISIGLGYRGEVGLMGSAQVQWNNLFGRGQKINFMADIGVGQASTETITGIDAYGGTAKNFQFSFTEPWLFGKHTLAGIDIYSTFRYRDAWREKRAGTSLKLGPHLDEDTNLLFTYTYERVTIPWARNEIEKDEEGRISSSLASYFIRDTRDNIFDATKGSRLSVSLKKTGGILQGDNDFLKSGITANVFFPLFWKFVIGSQVKFGGVFSPAEGSVPIYERYFVGGGETVRGYKYGFRSPEIGVEDGGKLMFVGNIELKLPFVKQGRNTVVQGVLFFDVGGTWDTFNDVELTMGSKPTRLKAGFGAGIRFTPMPMFPIRLDWGYPLNNSHWVTFERDWEFYLTIGPTF